MGSRVARGPITLGIVAALLGLVAITPAAAAYPQPGVFQIQPASGDVVATGPVLVAGVMTSSKGIGSARLVVDGVEYPIERTPWGSPNERFEATISLPNGSHVADLLFYDNEGRAGRRLWRFDTTDTSITRIAGADRIATAVAMSRDTYPDGGTLTAAVLATATDFPDALAAAPVARRLDGPLLLTNGAALSAATRDELRRLLSPLATVWLMGGPSALSSRVEQDVRDLGFDVQRLAGPTREATAADAATRHLPDATTVVVSSSRSFADALSASAPAARDGAPILLTDRSNLSAASRQFIESHEITRAIVVGGESVVTEGVLAQLRTLVPTVERVAGADRYATSLAVLARFYPGPVPGVSIASGVGFADALAGASHAAARGNPLVLSGTSGLAEDAVRKLTELDSPPVHLYGGAAALDWRVPLGVRRAAVNQLASPRVLQITPTPATTVTDVETIQVQFDREILVEQTAVYVTIDGYEWVGTAGQGDFKDTLVFQPGGLPIRPDRNVDHDIDLFVLSTDGERRHYLHANFHLRRLEVSRGDVGDDVRELQQRLIGLGYWIDEADGEYGYLTSQAVMAFQKWEGLGRTGTADRQTLDRLLNAARPTPRSPRNGRWVEVDKTRQVMLFNLNGAVQWVMNTSTGTEKEYTRPDGSKGVAHTPEGEFTFTREIDGMREADLGQMWRPKYFTSQGHAIHGSTSVPAYGASHGCARLSYPSIDYVWAAGLAPVGTRILIYR